jgi:hypothetical protein
VSEKGSPEMQPTSIRVAKRTANLINLVATAVGVDRDKMYTADEFLWEVLTNQYPEYVELARKTAQRSNEPAEGE